VPGDGPPDPPAGFVVAAGGPPSPAEASAVLGLADAAARADGVAPLSEHVLLHLKHGGDENAQDLLLTVDGELSGYAHLDLGESASGELVIDPLRRGQGLGLFLGGQLEAQAREAPLRVWAHGDLPAAARLAAAAGFQQARSLWQMRRSLQPAIASPRITEGITIRTFVAGRDEDEWTGLNARAFAGHPEQGAWTREDLELREQEPWFDPGGFFLADRGGSTRRSRRRPSERSTSSAWTPTSAAPASAALSPWWACATCAPADCLRSCCTLTSPTLPRSVCMSHWALRTTAPM
jgi:GNAT superfamily N-acetyltransferase